MRVVWPETYVVLLALLVAPAQALASDRVGVTLRDEIAKCRADGVLSAYSESANTCFSFGGYMWGENYYNSFADYPSNYKRTYGIATLGVKAKTTTHTELGALKTFTNLQFQYRTSNEWAAGPYKFQLVPYDAFMTWAGFTFGTRGSLFDFYSNANVQGTDPSTIGDSQQMLLAAYTRQLGNGWSASISVETPWVRVGGIYAADANAIAGFNQNSTMPDFVGVLAKTAPWGEFQLSGALHRVKTKTFATPAIGYTGSANAETWGYALQAGVVFDFKPLSAGNSLFLQAAWSDGATTYLGLVNASGVFNPPDAFISANGRFSRVSGWNFVAQYLYNWTPTLQSAAFGGYAKFYLDNSQAKTTYGASGGANYNLGVNLTWTPVHALSFVIQYQYNIYMANNFINTGNGMSNQAQGAHQALLMAQHRF